MPTCANCNCYLGNSAAVVRHVEEQHNVHVKLNAASTQNGKYRNGTIWCTGVDDVIGRLEMGKSAV